jgi:hypothetical protein
MDEATPDRLWAFLPWGYLLTVLVETPVLLIGLSARHPVRRRLIAGLWLTACTYPIVILVLPTLMHDASRAAYLAVAETFAPAAECALFYFTFLRGLPEANRRATLRDLAAIIVANVASFLLGEWLGPMFL